MRAVCPAIKDIRNDEKKEASYVTMQMYMADEKRLSYEEGIQTGVLSAISNLMKTMGWPIERAMEALSVPDTDREQYAAMLQQGQETTP